MEKQELSAKGLRLVIKENNQEIGRIRIYFIENDLHDYPYALIEDLFVDENHREKGLGTKLMLAAIEEAKIANCGWIIANSRYEREYAHKFYLKLGFKDYGKEFKMNLK
jgi:GNAT superfamily N-acetyltransferase